MEATPPRVSLCRPCLDDGWRYDFGRRRMYRADVVIGERQYGVPELVGIAAAAATDRHRRDWYKRFLERPVKDAL